MAKKVFEALWNREGHPDTLIKEQGLAQISDPRAIDTLVKQVIAANPEQVREFREGKKKILSFFVGQIMRLTRGQANPEQVTQALRRQL